MKCKFNNRQKLIILKIILLIVLVVVCHVFAKMGYGTLCEWIMSQEFWKIVF